MKGSMKLVSPETGLMECQVCGNQHQWQIRPSSGGKLYRKNWKCKNGCEQGDVTKSQCS